MTRVRLLSIREETPDEAALRTWFANQVTAAPETLEAAARLLVGLVTGLLTVLFGVLALAADPLPAYLGHWAIRVLGIWSVLALLGGLLCALVVVVPRRLVADAGLPETQKEAFEKLVDRKAGWLRAAVITFGLGVVFLAATLIVALLLV